MTNLIESIIEDDIDTQKGKYLAFMIDQEMFGMEIRFVTEIISMQAITEMPEMPEYIKGIINLRGRIIPVMDVRLRFHKSPRDYDDRTCVIVINFNSVSIGFIVDRVSEVLTISDDDISERPNIKSTDNRCYVNNIGKAAGHVILLLNCENLLSSNELEDINCSI